MKGKISRFNKSLTFATVLLMATICVFVPSLQKPEQTRAFAAEVIADELFSQKDQNNIILSAEKVAVVSTGEDYVESLSNYLSEDYSFKKDWVDETPEEMQVASNSYKFKNIPNGSFNKTVINNNSFAMLENESYTKNGTTYYRNVAHSNSSNTLAEAVLFSFGGYYAEYKNADDPSLVTGTQINGADKGAGLQFVRVSATRNGEAIVLPYVREYEMNGSTYQDFAYIIPQKSGFDGYYKFTVKYFYQEYEYTQEFSFYLIFKSTYTDNVASGLFEYATKPTIENFVENRDGAYRYYLGEEADGQANGQYPTLTFDYSKYKLTYTHTANGIVASYNWKYVEIETLSGISKKLVCETTLNGETFTTEYPLQSSNRSVNTAVILLTEIGTYRFNYEYLYRGYKAENMPEIGLPLQSETLIIHGFELKYSKEGYAEAQMRKVEIAKTDANIDLIVPNGYVLGTKPTSEKLGIAYTINSTSSAKVGAIIESQTEDALLSSVMDVDNLVSNDKVNQNFTFVTDEDGKAIGTQLSLAGWLALQELLTSSSNFQKTNQGSLWLATTDEFVKTTDGGEGTANDTLGSFYYYTPTLDIDVLNLPSPAEFSNQTTFNAPGYYLVFVRVKTDIAGEMFYQAFAFQYTTDTVNIKVVTEGENPEVVGSNKFTNKNVKVTWQKPGTFEREITANYYHVKNQYYNKSTLLTTTANPLQSGDVLGTNIATGEGASYLIELKTEGSAATYRMFTIDRQHITGVSAYAVQEVYAEDKVYYEFATAKTGTTYQQLINSISDSFTSVYWDNKASGAKIFAKYSFTPIIKSNEQAKEINPTANQVWFTTNYKLGKTVGPFDIGKAGGLDNEIAYSNVIVRDGIYIYTLTDEAGNTTKFMVVIDSTGSYIKVDGEMKSNEAFISGDDVQIKLATHKVLPLFNQGETELDGDLLNFIELASKNSNKQAYAQKGYFVQDGTNLSALNALFSSFNNTYYLTVQNTTLSVYDNRPAIDANLSRENISTSNNEFTMEYDNSGSSMIRTFYLKGKNQIRLDNIVNSRSFVTIEINTDNSRLMAFYSNDEILENRIPNSLTNDAGVYRLYTSNTFDDNVKATSENYVAITWLVGTGLYEVATIKYDYYSLNFDFFGDGLFFYTNKLSKEGGETLYDSSKESPTSSRVVKPLNVVDGKTRDGLYVITRTYVGNLADFNNADSKDKFVQTYYLIVDRNNIIEKEETNGGNISIGILNGERLFNNFVSSGLEVGTTTLPEIAEYNIYLKSNVLPATYNIPATKYFNGTNGSFYGAGRLKFTLYFVDVERQLSENGKILKLFDVHITELVDASKYSNGYYKINIAEFINEADRSKLLLENNQENWLCLPGDYVVVISDGVESGGKDGAHSQVIGFRIPKSSEATSKPSTQVYATVNKDGDFNSSISAIEQGQTTLVTSEEFVKIELPAYDLNNYESAQVDINYLVVNQTRDGVTSKFIDHKYNNLGGTVSLLTNSDYVANKVSETDGRTVVSRTITLPTYLRNGDGTINLEALGTSLSYEIVIRFRLYNNKENPSDKYSNCYYYFDSSSSNIIYFYETVYTVILDRQAPTDNINQLLETDSLVNYYIEPDEQMFETAVYENGSRVYFVNQYKKYFEAEENASFLYAFKVTPETTFIKGEDANKGVNKIYYRNSADLSALQLDMPVTNFVKYTQVNVENVSGTYGSIFSNENLGKFIEVLEVDKAGNTSQYVIFYSSEDENNNYDNLDISLSFNLLEGSEIKDATQRFGPEITVNPLTVFNVALFDEFEGDNNAKDKFYRFELKNVNTSELKFINTNATTEFDNSDLLPSIVNMFNTSGQGNYLFIIRSRTSVSQTTINYYNKDEIINLSIEKLVETRGGQYVINLKGANTIKNGIVYYAKEITIAQGANRATYVCNPANNYNYYIPNEQDSYDIITGLDGTYQLTMTDAFGKVSTYRFNTTGKAYYEIEFNGGHFVENGVYYSLSSAVINYDTSLYSISATINNESFNTDSATEKYFDETLIFKVIKEEGRIELYPYYKNLGKKFEYAINFIYGSETEFSYNVVLDTTTGAVNLMDTSNAGQPMEYFHNVNYKDAKPTKTASGTMNLSWVKNTNSKFTYEYILHEIKKDGTYANLDLTGETNHIINTASDSEGIYKFEIRIYGANGVYLANKIYAFSVQNIVNHLYYVQDENLKAISHNEYFKIDDIINDYRAKLSAIGISVASGYPKQALPLYISNQNLSIVVATDQDARHEEVEIFATANVKGQKYVFSVHKIYTSTYAVFCGVLKVDKSENIVENVALEYKTLDEEDETKTKIITENLATTSNLSYFKTEAIDGVYTLKLSQYITQYASEVEVSSSAQNIAKKNSLIIDVFYNDEFVETVNLKNSGNVGEYEYLIKGSGKYTFTIKDVAGNAHTFFMESGIEQNYVEITTLSEVVIKVNGKSPIQNAYYNGQVVVNVHNPSLYDLTPQISVKATRNGANYTPIKSQYYYTFKHFGTYRFTITAMYRGKALTKTIVFTIINPKEAVESIDLTTIGNYEIEQVTNQNGKDITMQFVQMLNNNKVEENPDGRLLTYNEIMNCSQALGITAGKQTFSLTYSVNDGIYPKQTVTFAFTMNNEIPTINSSIAPGESTTKGFSITFNPGIIYEQVGEAYIYITIDGKDTLIGTINENSAMEMSKIEILEKTHGAGDYYVKLQSSSGNIISSFKVVVKEPLNVWAIIVIVVVASAVIGVTITIIVLRNKMKIR